MSVDMIRILSFPAFPALDAVIPLSFVLVAPVFLWIVVIVFFCHSISYCYVLICFILPSIIYYLSYRKLLSFSLYNLAIINDIHFHCCHVILRLFQAFFGHGISIRIRRHRFTSAQPWPNRASVSAYRESDFKLDLHAVLVASLIPVLLLQACVQVSQTGLQWQSLLWSRSPTCLRTSLVASLRLPI